MPRMQSKAAALDEAKRRWHRATGAPWVGCVTGVTGAMVILKTPSVNASVSYYYSAEQNVCPNMKPLTFFCDFGVIGPHYRLAGVQHMLVNLVERLRLSVSTSHSTMFLIVQVVKSRDDVCQPRVA